MVIILLLLGFMASGCASTQYDTRPFYLPEQGADTHGKKSWFDHLVEVDPGRLSFAPAEDYAQDPPERIAVLPFVDHGTAQYVVDKVPVSMRDEKERQLWAWTYANRLRRSITGQLAEREFVIIPIPVVDAALKDHGIDNWEKLKQIAPEQFGQWLGADTVVYGNVLHYEAYYLFLVASWQVGADIRLVSTRDGHVIFAGHDTRNAVDFRPAFDPISIGVNSALSLLQLRDVTLARAEDEVAREIALRLPLSQRNLANLRVAALRRAEELAPEPDIVIDPPAAMLTPAAGKQPAPQALDPNTHH